MIEETWSNTWQRNQSIYLVERKVNRSYSNHTVLSSKKKKNIENWEWQTPDPNHFLIAFWFACSDSEFFIFHLLVSCSCHLYKEFIFCIFQSYVKKKERTECDYEKAKTLVIQRQLLDFFFCRCSSIQYTNLLRNKYLFHFFRHG